MYLCIFFNTVFNIMLSILAREIHEKSKYCYTLTLLMLLSHVSRNCFLGAVF